MANAKAITVKTKCLGPMLLVVFFVAFVIPEAVAARFAVASTNVVGDNARSIAAGDFDADGKPDFVTANLDANSISVCLGVGDGTFTSRIDYPIAPFDHPLSAGLRRVSTADFNHDGRTDVVVSYGYEFGRLAVFTATNGGNLVRHPDLAESRYCDSVDFADFNGDGRLDLVVSGYAGNYVTVHFGQGNGLFGSRSNFDTVGLPDCVAAGDFNRDGRPDIVAASSTNSFPALVVLLNQPSGDFINFITATNLGLYPQDEDPIARSLAVRDFDGDGSLDVAVGFEDRPLMVMVLQREGQFSVSTNLALLGQAFHTVTADFDGNGFPDLATPLDFLTGIGDGGFSVLAQEEFGWSGSSIAVADVNLDGRPDTLWTGAGRAICSTNNHAAPLRIRKVGAQVELSWPAWNGFVLEAAANLTSAVWRPVPSGPALVNGRYTWALPAEPPMIYFRLSGN